MKQDSYKPTFDIRAEVLGRLIATEKGYTTEQMLHYPKFFHQRRGRKDVIELTDSFSDRLGKKLICIETSREGFFDILPESIFLHPDDDYANEVEKMRELSAQEAAARKFLVPFEQMFFWLRLENELRESNTENRLGKWCNELFEHSDKSEITDRQQEILIEMLPNLPDIIGNWLLTQQWLEMLIERPVQITLKKPPHYELPDNVQKRMGEGILGQDFVIGNDFSDGIPALEIHIGNLQPSDLVNYLPTGAKREVFENELLAWLLPVETPFSVVLDVDQTQQPFEISENGESSILGYTILL